jgi:hypothetical protein
MASSKKSPSRGTASKKSTRSEKKPAARKKAAESRTKAAPSKSTKPGRLAAAPKASPAKAPAAKETPTSSPPSPPISATRPRPRRAKGAAPAEAPAPPRKETRRKSAGPPRTVAVTVGSGVASKLGNKWACFQCGARFYDLNKPEPLCPRCGADQRLRPKSSPTPPAPPAQAKRPPRPMAPLLDDEDDGTVRYDEEFDLGVRTDIDEAEEELFPPGEMEEEDVFNEDE